MTIRPSRRTDSTDGGLAGILQSVYAHLDPANMLAVIANLEATAGGLPSAMPTRGPQRRPLEQIREVTVLTYRDSEEWRLVDGERIPIASRTRSRSALSEDPSS